MKQSLMPITLEESHVTLLKSGCLFIHGRDRFHRPLLFMRPVIICKLGFANRIDEICRTIAFVFLYLVNHMTLPGKVESSIRLIDMQKAKPWELPLKSLAAMQTELA
jgi:hypothetical protein